VLLILVTFGVAATISDAWDVYQLARMLLDEDLPASPTECFGREDDVRKMESRLGERPEFIYFVGGSPRSGLTTVVNKVLNDYAGNSFVINLRECAPMTGMEDVTHSLNKSLRFLEILPSFQSLKHHFSGWEIKGILIPATEAQRIEALKSTLNKLTLALKFMRFLSRLKSSHTRENTYPIIAFDHFKEVMNIPESKETLNVLLKWALYITHEAHLAHVILVSNDPKVAYALTNDELLTGRIISINIDSIAKEPALTYLRKRLARSRYPREITEEEGEKIFSEIGSAFLDLNRVEAHLSSTPKISVDQALDIMHRTTIAHLVGALGAEGRSWTPTQLWRTIKMLAESETGELDYFQLKTQVFHGNEKTLHELFDAGILLYRVFPHKRNGLQMTPVVAAYTPFVMYCCKQLANDPRINAIMNRQMADEEAAASSLGGRLSSAMLMVS